MDGRLLSSEVEGLPNVLIEAQELGVPIKPPMPAALEHGVTGVVVQEDAVEGLARSCVLYFNKDALRDRAHIEAPQLTSARFGLTRMPNSTPDVFGMSHLGLPEE